MIKNNKGVDVHLDGIKDEWFEHTAQLILNGQYKFKNAKQIEIPKPGGKGNRILTITDGKDKIIQKAMTILLEAIYENNNLFQPESHGFRPGRGCHTALHQIKYS
jgi:retron-type reverse transcriptase